MTADRTTDLAALRRFADAAREAAATYDRESLTHPAGSYAEEGFCSAILAALAELDRATEIVSTVVTVTEDGSTVVVPEEDLP